MRRILIALFSVLMLSASACGHSHHDEPRRYAAPHTSEFYFNYTPNPYQPYNYEFEQPYGFGYYYAPNYYAPRFDPPRHEHCR